MSKSMLATERGFILEGKVCGEAHPSDVDAARPVASKPDADPLHRSLLEGLTQFGGERVRITVEVLRQSSTDRLRDLIEQFREESEELPSRNILNGG